MSDREAAASDVRRGRRMLLALAALFLLPLAVAFALYYGGSWRPAGSASHGELIVPARALPQAAGAAALHGKWTLVYAGDGACDPACRRALHVMRQTRLALNDEMTRVQRVLLATGGCCDRDFLEREHAGLVVLDASQGALRELLAAFPREDREHAVFIVDPLGNLMMRQDVRASPRGFLRDLRKLLELSHIG